MSDDGLNVVRILFHDIQEGDRLKFEAQSHTASTGGGARDLRFRPESAFLPFFRRVFSETQIRKSTSGGGTNNIEVSYGKVHWTHHSDERSATMEVWPSTYSRPGETRIGRISSFGFSDLIETDPRGGRSIFMLFQQKNGDVRIHFTTETSLRRDQWDTQVKEFAEYWFNSGKISAFLDLETEERYPDD